MKILVLILVIICGLLAYGFHELYDANESLIAKTIETQHKLEAENQQLEKDKVEQFYRGIYEVCMVINGKNSDCLDLVKSGIQDDFYHDSAGGWKYPLDNSE